MSTYEKIALEGKINIIVNAFREGFPVELIAKIAEISVEKSKKLLPSTINRQVFS